MLKYRTATAADAQDLAGRLREADRREIEAAEARPPVDVLGEGVATSEPAVAMLDANDRLIGLFGVRPMATPPGLGVIWMVGSDELERHGRDLVRDGRAWVQRLHEHYEILCNVADARNEQSLRWLERIGFTLLRTLPNHGPHGRPFVEFASVRPSEDQ